MNSNLSRRKVMGMLAILFGCHSKPPSPTPMLDESRFHLTEIRLNRNELGEDSTASISVKQGDLLEFEGNGPVAAGIMLPPKESGAMKSGPVDTKHPVNLSGPKPTRSGKPDEKMMGVDFWFVIVKAGTSPVDGYIESSMFTTHTDRKEAAFEGKLPAPKSAGKYEVQGYALWLDVFSRATTPDGIVEPERHLIFSRPLQVE